MIDLNDTNVAPSPEPRPVAMDSIGLSAEFFGTHVELRWNWSDLQAVRVGWRQGGAPAGRDDPDAQWRRATMSEYRRNGGLRLVLGSGSWGISIYPDVIGDRCASVTVRIPSATVECHVRRRLGRPNEILLTLSSDAHLSLPEIAVICSLGDTQPQETSEGVEIGRMRNVLLAAGERRSLHLAIPQSRPLFVRPFFTSAGAYESIDLIDPPPDEARLIR